MVEENIFNTGKIKFDSLSVILRGHRQEASIRGWAREYRRMV